ncbi:hypothetical protein COV04_02845 [Candidatus Uhrbacteria bacterium CG10_big_fil_rev_8_21_14_0_10_48_11]|uniref:Glycosyltransferase subfamily 4-like N-terminal domain-containing protein n=1 Tax=Candidatus Uhrbacteria bacterium CG10_big_fil_rev_8_21_14_0_10_48_11 TaxID=1975037 RepID=A0A2M8LEJ3_9BACT|nr:MAG: hypothetical protein COV04_02845 [Candidatus Uhrbacteria bacterium CG10_big_fil_rev_8_21_14_0_10_48_11]
MKVLTVSNLYRPYSRGGAETVVQTMSEGFQEAGWQVSILTTTPFAGSKSFRAELSLEGKESVYRFFPLNLFSYAFIGKHSMLARALWGMIDICNLHSYVVARRVLSREQPDLVVTHNLRGLGYLLPRLFAKHAKRYVHIVHDVQLVEPSGLLFSGEEARRLRSPLRRVYRLLTRYLFSSIPITIFPSQFLNDFYTRYGLFSKTKKVVLPNAAPTSNQKKKGHDGINFVYIGQIEKQKGITVLLEAWSQMKHENCRLLLVGAGSYLSAVQKAATRDTSIIASGFLTQEQLDAIWEVADVFVYPSLLLENCPRSIIEALSRGVLVVASDSGGMAELTALSSGIKMVPAGDSGALAKALFESIDSTKVGDSVAPVVFATPKEYIEKLIDLTQKT